jgi:hypothetical protein
METADVYARAVVHSLAIRFPNQLSEQHLASNNIPVLIYFLEMEYPIVNRLSDICWMGEDRRGFITHSSMPLNMVKIIT